jgi:hypothetical protein
MEVDINTSNSLYAYVVGGSYDPFLVSLEGLSDIISLKIAVKHAANKQESLSLEGFRLYLVNIPVDDELETKASKLLEQPKADKRRLIASTLFKDYPNLFANLGQPGVISLLVECRDGELLDVTPNLLSLTNRSCFFTIFSRLARSSSTLNHNHNASLINHRIPPTSSGSTISPSSSGGGLSDLLSVPDADVASPFFS